jgi:amyloid beta A4 precursor protein-binding family A member 2
VLKFLLFLQSTKHLTLVRLVVVPCPPVVEVLIKRPDTKYQLGFSVQDGIVNKIYSIFYIY